MLSQLRARYKWPDSGIGYQLHKDVIFVIDESSSLNSINDIMVDLAQTELGTIQISKVLVDKFSEVDYFPKKEDFLLHPFKKIKVNKTGIIKFNLQEGISKELDGAFI